MNGPVDLATAMGTHPPTEDRSAARTFQFVAAGDLQYRAPEFLIDGLIETDTLGLLFGEPGCGKSFLAVDIGLCVATGAAFHGRGVKGGPVFLIAGEGHNGLARRFAAWAIARGVSLNDALLFKSNRAAQFLDAANARNVADAVEELAGLHGEPALIIIDTLARNFGAGDENSTSDMGGFITAVDDLKARFPGCAVLIVHHSGHADKGRARGAMALKAALDCEYRVEKDADAIRLINTKMKDAEPPRDLHFALKSVDLADGATSAVLEETDAPDRHATLSPTQQMAVTAFIDAAAQSGTFDGGLFIGLSLDDWQAAFLCCHTGDNPQSKKRAFRRARGELVQAGILACADDVYSTDNSDHLVAILEKRTGRTSPDKSAPVRGVKRAGRADGHGHPLIRVSAVRPTDRCLINDDQCARCAGEGCAWCNEVQQ
ncbi:AAA family ATPase [Blastomonas fulva]|uniref:AAA family ATPase n=1 Tax=Blastomonas fulva TaxID=1550728 RepID=UPI0025A4545E|nr:AAA family ATPase [Blastomonas fulva]MDM7929837.1 AAA family ATPase [Blastomonas fulva]MDM7966798.1 AAA family ATPase [Blastomonas fulva]